MANIAPLDSNDEFWHENSNMFSKDLILGLVLFEEWYPWHILSPAKISFEFLIRKQRFTSKESGGKVGGESSTNKQTKSQIFFTLSAIWPRVKNTEFCLQESRNAIWTYYYDGQGFQKYGITEMFAEYESLNVNSKNWRTTRVNTKDGGCEAKYLCFWKWRKFIFDLRFRDEGGKVAKMRKWIDFLKSDMSTTQWLKITLKCRILRHCERSELRLYLKIYLNFRAKNDGNLFWFGT